MELFEGQKNILDRAIRYYGRQHQMTKALEELAELSVEVAKHKSGEDNMEALASEMADVYIMLAQIQTIAEITDNTLSDYIAFKMGRLLGRMDADIVTAEDLGIFDDDAL